MRLSLLSEKLNEFVFNDVALSHDAYVSFSAEKRSIVRSRETFAGLDIVWAVGDVSLAIRGIKTTRPSYLTEVHSSSPLLINTGDTFFGHIFISRDIARSKY